MSIESSVRRRVGSLFLAVVLAGSLTGAAGPASGAKTRKAPRVAFWLTVLHNNDGESQLIDLGGELTDFGGAARFETLVDKLRSEAVAGKRKRRKASIMVSSGDNFLAGPEFNVSLDKGPPFYDAMALDLIGYDAIAIGNHDFDFGPDVLAEFIESFASDTPFLSSNLDFSAEAVLKALEDEGRIAASTIVTKKGQEVGVIGATTPGLRSISSPRNVVVGQDVAGAVQAEVDALEALGVNKIVLISHLQSIEEDLALAPELSGVDVMVAGGGDEVLANEDDVLVPGDEEQIFGSYPLEATDADGRMVPVVTTKGSYSYVGRLMVGFNARGRVIKIRQAKSGPVRVAGGSQPDAVAPDSQILKWVVEPIVRAVQAIADNIIGTSEVALDGRRPEVRTRETNEGNLIADALLSVATERAADFGVAEPEVALQNGGGIRNDSIIGPGEISELDTFSMLPFANFLSVVPDVSAETFKRILENAVSRVENVDGRFAQIAGFTFTYDPTGTAQEIDVDGNITTEGSRIQDVTLDGGTPLVVDGTVVPGAPSVNVATIDFLARGGDQYPFGGADFTTLGITYQQALQHFIETTLGGLISSADYPEGGEGRITTE